MKLTKLLPWIVGVVALVSALFLAMPTGKVHGFDMNGFAKLPVLEGGRVKPLDSVARNTLLLIRSKQTVPFEGKDISADQWILDLMFRPEVADRQPVFIIDDPDLLGQLGQKLSKDRYLASFEMLGPHIDELEKQAKIAQPIDAKKRTRYQSAVVNLFERVYMYFRLKNTLQLSGTPGLAVQMQAVAAPQAAEMHSALTQLAMFRILPPLAGQKADAWQSVGEALQAGAMSTGQPLHPGLAPLSRIATAYGAQDATAFNSSVAEFQGIVTGLQPEAMSHANNEITFNRAQPFYVGMVIYVLALLTIFVSWIWKRELLQPTAFALLLVGAIVHTCGLAFRIILQGRPPVTNLYSSAVFVGWGAVVLGIVLERMYRKGFGTAVATAAGFGSLIVAQHLAEGDTMEMMRAVLDSNFWLATHVVTITIGYSGTFLAGAIAIAYTLWKHIAPDPDPETGKVLVGMAYGIICFSLLFSFVGTVLGGIWADQSWGRFWGWDPKENGALLIVLWNAIILHARWSGMARDRGIMTMAIFGNVITSLSWFGVNMLGVGLHSYGFMDSAFYALSAFIATQLLLMGLCMMPRRFQFQKPSAKA